jgi:hypothetical protein
LKLGLPWSGGAAIGKIIFTGVYIEKKFPKTSRPISIKLGITHPKEHFVNGIQSYTNEEPGPL